MKKRLVKTAMERFLSHVCFSACAAGDPCWVWLGQLAHDGYARFHGNRNPGETKIAARWAFMLFKGEIPRGKLILHSCDRRDCVNPNHLRIGTFLDNYNDQEKHWGRSDLGEKNPN